MSTTLAAYTILHVAISLAAIFAGIVVLYGMLSKREWAGWTKFFLTTTVLTSLTGFFFPFHGFTPALGNGIISIVVLAIAIYARYGLKLAGIWRNVYVISAVFALYLNVFVLVVQLFLKVPSLKQIAPTQKDPPFVIAQLTVLVAFIILGILATSRYRNSTNLVSQTDSNATVN
jgi:hypothetical protein